MQILYSRELFLKIPISLLDGPQVFGHVDSFLKNVPFLFCTQQSIHRVLHFIRHLFEITYLVLREWRLFWRLLGTLALALTLSLCLGRRRLLSCTLCALRLLLLLLIKLLPSIIWCRVYSINFVWINILLWLLRLTWLRFFCSRSCLLLFTVLKIRFLYFLINVVV